MKSLLLADGIRQTIFEMLSDKPANRLDMVDALLTEVEECARKTIKEMLASGLLCEDAHRTLTRGANRPDS